MNKKNNFSKSLQFAATFGAGFAGGMLSGLLISNRIAAARRMPFAAEWERIMAQERGHVQASCFINRCESKYWQLYCQRPHMSNLTLREHLNENILPGLAVYQTLQDEGLEMKDSLATVENLIYRAGRTKRRPVELLTRTPSFYQMLRYFTPRFLERNFPPEGFEIEWVENSESRVAFNITSCFYLDVLTAYGVPELTLVYCNQDDLIYEGASPTVLWERTGTLARGDEVCDFSWAKVYG